MSMTKGERRASKELSEESFRSSRTFGSSGSILSAKKWLKATSRRSHALCKMSELLETWGEEHLEKDLRPAERTERARSKAPGLAEGGGDCIIGEPQRLSLRWSLWGVWGADLGLLTALRDGNQTFFREGETGIPMRACMTWVKGGVIGFGKLGGRDPKIRRRGGSNLRDMVSDR